MRHACSDDVAMLVTRNRMRRKNRAHRVGVTLKCVARDESWFEYSQGLKGLASGIMLI